MKFFNRTFLRIKGQGFTQTLTFKKKLASGFTLVEMLVAIGILMLISSAAIASFGSFNEELSLTNLAYDVALTIREAQYYGISNKAAIQDKDFNYGYGVEFDVGFPERYITFVDRLPDGAPDRKFMGLGDCGEDKQECLLKYNIYRGNHISGINLISGGTCSSKNRVDVVFERPSPKVSIVFNNDPASTMYPGAVVELSSPNEQKRYITIRDSGQISVTKENPCP